LTETFEVGDHSFGRTDSFKYLVAVVVTTKNKKEKKLKPGQLLEINAILHCKGF
jgi:exosome complex RNA-binding protein Rrp4